MVQDGVLSSTDNWTSSLHHLLALVVSLVASVLVSVLFCEVPLHGTLRDEVLEEGVGNLHEPVEANKPSSYAEDPPQVEIPFPAEASKPGTIDMNPVLVEL